MKRRLSTIFLALACSTATLLAAAEGPPTERWNAAWESADATALTALYTEDARVITPNFPAKVGHTDIEAMFTRMMGRNMTMVSTVIEDLESEDVWVRRTDFEMFFGGQHLDDGEAVEVWRKIGGEWLLHLEIFTSRNIRPIAYDDPAPEYDNIHFVDKPGASMRPTPRDSQPAPEDGAEGEAPASEQGEAAPPADSPPPPTD